jgi:4-deoxy-L-threo-5-hexosulose-uronate ketol-isomerase
MEVRSSWNPADVKSYDTARMRKEFLIQGLFSAGSSTWVYSHVDRVIVGGLCPQKALTLPVAAELKAEYFLQRREMAVVNIGPKGSVTVDGTRYELDTRDGLYIGMGAKNVVMESADPKKPAKLYALSAPAHHAYPTTHITLASVAPLRLGSPGESNVRTIYKYIQPGGVKSCQLVMGMTLLEANSVWNSMPCHTHDRRMEVYLYFDLPEKAVVFHFMGDPRETRHLVMRNEEAVIAPSWSIHTGVGTSNYGFIWGMAGENQEFTDMDAVAMSALE